MFTRFIVGFLNLRCRFDSCRGHHRKTLAFFDESRVCGRGHNLEQHHQICYELLDPVRAQGDWMEWVIFP